MRKLAKNTRTAEMRMGSHRAVSETTRASFVGCLRCLAGRKGPPYGYAARLVRREYLQLPLLVERDNVVCLRLYVWYLHTGRSDRHTGNRKSNDRRPFLEQPLHISGRYMAFNHVSVDNSRVA